MGQGPSHGLLYQIITTKPSLRNYDYYHFSDENTTLIKWIGKLERKGKSMRGKQGGRQKKRGKEEGREEPFIKCLLCIYFIRRLNTIAFSSQILAFLQMRKLRLRY